MLERVRVETRYLVRSCMGFRLVRDRASCLKYISMIMAIIEFTIPGWAALELEKTTGMFAYSQ